MDLSSSSNKIKRSSSTAGQDGSFSVPSPFQPVVKREKPSDEDFIHSDICVQHNLILDLFCENCQECICHACMMNDIHQGHKMNRSKDVFESKLNDLNVISAEIQKVLNDFVAQKIKLQEILNQYNARKMDQITRFKTLMENEKLDHRKHMNLYNAEVDNINGHMERLQHFIDVIRNKISSLPQAAFIKKTSQLIEEMENEKRSIKKNERSVMEFMKLDVPKFTTSHIPEQTKFTFNLKKENLRKGIFPKTNRYYIDVQDLYGQNFALSVFTANREIIMTVIMIQYANGLEEIEERTFNYEIGIEIPENKYSHKILHEFKVNIEKTITLMKLSDVQGKTGEITINIELKPFDISAERNIFLNRTEFLKTLAYPKGEIQRHTIQMAELKNNSKIFNYDIKGINLIVNAKLFIEKERIFLDVFPTSTVVYKYTLDRLVINVKARLLKNGLAVRRFQRNDWFPENNKTATIVKKDKGHMVMPIFDIISETLDNDYDQMKIEFSLQPESYKALWEIFQKQACKNEQSD